MDQSSLEAFDARHHLNFRNPSLLRQAFVHRSYVNEQVAGNGEWLYDNERLEFLGDSVLGFVVSDYLYHTYPHALEGALTHLRTVVVRREALAKLAQQMHIGDLLLVGVGEEESGGRTRLATLCAAFEALVGAIYLDQGVDKVREFLLPRVQELLANIEPQTTPKDPKSRFQEWAQRTLGVTPRYRVIESFGPDHAKQFISQVSVKGEAIGVGLGPSKQDASQAAAAMALYRVGELSPEFVDSSELATRFNMTESVQFPIADSAPG